MSLRLTPKFLIAGFLLASVIALGTMYVSAQNGSSSASIITEDISLEGTISSIDDHGFVLVTDSGSYYVVLPDATDKDALDLTVGSTASVTGYIVDCLLQDGSDATIVHATSVNGIVIDNNSQYQSQGQSKKQNQSHSGDCDGSGDGEAKQYKNGKN